MNEMYLVTAISMQGVWWQVYIHRLFHDSLANVEAIRCLIVELSKFSMFDNFLKEVIYMHI